MKRLEKLYDKKYSVISIYAVKTALMIFVLGLLIYFLAGKIGVTLTFVSAVLKPLVLGIVFTYLLSPIAEKLENSIFASVGKPGVRRVAAVVLTLIIVLAAIGLILGIIAVTVTKSLSGFNPSEAKEYMLYLSDQFANFRATIEDQLASMNINLGSVGSVIGKIFSGIKSGATTLLFALIFAIYFLIDDGIRVYWANVLEAFTNEKTRAKLKQFIADADRVFSGYIRGQSIDALLCGTMSSIALFIAGVPYGIVIGILTGLGNLVPYVGPIVGFSSLIIVCLAEGALNKLIIGGIILAAVMFIDGNIINPKMLSSTVKVHPVLVIVALLAGGGIGGIVGMLVAVPVAALIKERFDRYVEKRKQKNSNML